MRREVVGYRASGWDDPFWVLPNRSDGRYNFAGAPATQYVSLHPLGPFAEMLRRDDRRTAEEAAELRVRVWAIRILLPHSPFEELISESGWADSRHLDLTFGNVAALEMRPQDLIVDGYKACQELADTFRNMEKGPQVLCVPSAALPGTQNLVILGPRLRVPYESLDWDDEIDLPAEIVAEAAQPPPSLVSRVRYRGQPHAEYEAWQRGQRGASREQHGS